MAVASLTESLTGHAEFDSLITAMAETADPNEAEKLRLQIWEQFGTEGAVFISDMASFSSTSRNSGVCQFLQLIYRARKIIAPLIASNNGTLLKCDADNCYAFFPDTDDAIKASFEVNAALNDSNSRFGPEEKIYLSVGIDYGRVLIVDNIEYFGDPVNTASKLGEDLATRAEMLITQRALNRSTLEIAKRSKRMLARISDIEIEYVCLAITEDVVTELAPRLRKRAT